MTATAPLEELVRQALDRIARQERRVEALEASVMRSQANPAARPPLGSSIETPAEIGWPKRESAHKAAIPAVVVEQVKALEARLQEAEERLRAAARLEMLGRLVAGVSHDFNNLLTVITGYADTVRSSLPDGHHLRETADLIANTAQTAAGITRQLVSFGRPGKPELCPIDVNLAVRGIERTLRRLTGERVALEFFPAPRLALVRADPSQFDQVLLNLVVNARDAITGDGTITVRTAMTPVPVGRADWPNDVPPGEYVSLTTSDTGCGMAPEVLARVFDPFFTTKGERGSGLGLSTVRSIVRETGGHIEVESSVGWGTSVRVFWPLFPEAPPPNALRLARPT